MSVTGSEWGRWVALWLAAFALTSAIEIPLATALLPSADANVRRRAALSFFAQLASHPAVWFVFPALGALGVRWGASTAIAEAWAFGIEAIFYRVALPSLTWRRAVAVSAITNTVSFSAGLALGPLMA
jgi:hypothetical protein